jgi:Skp family chaperone for outer membrane proteins
MTSHTKLIQVLIAALLLSGIVTSAVIGSNEGKLGPIDELTLAGEKDLTITNVDDRISFGEEKTSKVWSVGFMEVGKALGQLLQAEHFIEERTDLNNGLETQLVEARDILQALSAEGQTMDPQSPEAPALRQKWERANNDFRSLQQSALNARNALLAEQMASSYTEIIEAVNVVAERLNIDMVLRFIPQDTDLIQETPEATMMQIRLRSALRLPEGIDITDEVLSELGLELQ